jgi:hypothetical protein
MNRLRSATFRPGTTTTSTPLGQTPSEAPTGTGSVWRFATGTCKPSRIRSTSRYTRIFATGPTVTLLIRAVTDRRALENPTRAARLTYHGFVTLTTSGYGDIIPDAPLTRNLAWVCLLNPTAGAQRWSKKAISESPCRETGQNGTQFIECFKTTGFWLNPF